MDTLLNDARYAVRTLLRSPGFLAVAVLALALGIGANTAIFSVVNGVLLKSLPLPEPERLVALAETSERVPVMAVSYPNYLDWVARQTLFESLAARMPAGGVLTGEGEPERVIGRWVTASFFPTLGVRPQLGRFFGGDEDRAGAERVMVISYSVWQRYFGGDPNLIGKTIFYNSEGWTVIGVMPRNFDFYGQTNLNNDFFIPISHITAQRYMNDRHSNRGVLVTGRMKPGVTLDQARAEMKTISDQLAREYPASNTGNSAVLKSFLRQGMVLSVIGVGAGLAGSVALTRLMSRLLFGVSATDPATFAVVSLVLTIVALAAC